MTYKKTFKLMMYHNCIYNFEPKVIKNKNLREELLSKEVGWDELGIHCWHVDQILSQVKSDIVVPFDRMERTYNHIKEYIRLDKLVVKPRKQKMGFTNEEE